ncbi:MAG: omega-amidase [Sphingobacteriales bacterium]|jgi:omega-amidase
MKTAQIQFNIAWENPDANFEKVNALLADVPQDTDCIILPEMFTTGFTMKPELIPLLSEQRMVEIMVVWAKEKDALVLGSCAIQEGKKYVNKLIWVKPSGEHGFYNKRHLFRMAGEDEKYTAGSKPEVVHFRGFKIALYVCYDLRFPVWSRNTEMVDLMVYVANWPAVRIHAWDALLTARAIENGCYSIGVNRVGEDGNGVLYNGHSACYDYKGDPLYAVWENEGVQVCTLNQTELTDFRKKFPAHLDADKFSIHTES